MVRDEICHNAQTRCVSPLDQIPKCLLSSQIGIYFVIDYSVWRALKVWGRLSGDDPSALAYSPYAHQPEPVKAELGELLQLFICNLVKPLPINASVQFENEH